jgi:uncharacterized protein (TIGR02246 family)
MDCLREATVDAVQLAGEVADGFAGAWNGHDMEAFGQLFHEDADFVNVVGLEMRGRGSIQRHHSAIHAAAYKNSTLRVVVEDAREIAPSVIIAHLHTQLEGDTRAPGQTRNSLLTLVVERRSGEWRIVAGHNTGIVPGAS